VAIALALSTPLVPPASTGFPLFIGTAQAPVVIAASLGLIGKAPGEDPASLFYGSDEEEQFLSFPLGLRTVPEVQPNFDAALGLGSPTDSAGSLPLTTRLEELDPSASFARSKADAEEEGGQSMLLFRVEGKALRVGSSLSEADDYVPVVESIVRAQGASKGVGPALAPAGPLAKVLPASGDVVGAAENPAANTAVKDNPPDNPPANPRPGWGAWWPAVLAVVVVLCGGGAVWIWRWWGRHRLMPASK
jgi:hypothetical protein